MTLRKNEMELPKYSSVSQWKMKNLHEGIRRFLRGDLDELTLYLCVSLSSRSFLSLVLFL